MANLAELFVKIGADIKGALKGFDDVEGRVGGFSTAVDKAGKVAFGALVGGVAAAGVGAALSAKQFLPYEQALANIQTIMPEGTRVNDEYDDAIKRLSVDLKASGGAAEVAAGLYGVLSAETLESGDALAVLEIAMKGAKAGLADTGSAVNLLTGVSKAYSGTVAPEMVQRISDLTFETVKLGQTTFPELAASMGAVAPIAASAGVSLEELFGTVATLTGVTGNTSEVTTQLRGAITSLLKPNADMVKIMSPLVTQLAEQGKLAPESAGGFLRLSAALQEARAAGDDALAADLESQLGSLMDTMGPAILQSLGLVGTFEALATNADTMNVGLASALGRVEAYNAVIALTGSQSDSAAARIEAMASAAGSTDRAFETMTDTSSARIQAWKNQFQVDMLEVGESVVLNAGVIGAAFSTAFGTQQVDAVTAITGAITALTPILAGLAAAAGHVTAFLIEHPTLAKGLALALGILGTALAATSVFMGIATTIAGAFGLSFTLMAGPVFLVIAAILAVGAAAYLIWKNWDQIAGFFRDSWDALKRWAADKFGAIVDGFRDFFLSVSRIFMPALDALVSYWTAIWETVKLVIATVLLTIKAILTGDLSLLLRVWSAFGSRLLEIWSTAWDRIKTGLVTALTNLSSFFLDGLGKLGTKTKEALEWLVSTVATLAVEIPLALLKGIGDIGKAAWDWFVEKMSTFTKKLNDWATGVIGMSPTLIQMGASIVGSILGGIGSMIGGIGRKVSEIAGAIAGAIIPDLDEMEEKGREVVNRLRKGLEAGKNWIKDQASDIAGTIRDHFPSSPAKLGPLRDEPDWMWLTEGIDGLGRDAQRTLRGELALLDTEGTRTASRGAVAQGVGTASTPIVFQPGSIVVNGSPDRSLLEAVIREVAIAAFDAEAGRRRREAGSF